MRFLATILAIPMVWCATPASNAWAAQDVVTAAVHRELDRAVSPQPGNEHLLRLSALRALRDQALKPLLISLAETGPPSIQIHALLGLAELAPDGCMELTRLQSVDPETVETAVLLGLNASCLHPDDMRTLLNDQSLTATTRLRLLSGLYEEGHPVSLRDALAINVLPDSFDQAVRAAQMACLGDASELDHLRTQVETSPDNPPLQERCFAALDQATRMPSEAADLLARTCLQREFPSGIRRFALMYALKRPGADRAVLFCEEFDRSPRRRHQVDLALLLLMTSTPVPDLCRDRFEEEPLLASVANASVHLPKMDTESADTLEQLISQQHRRTTTWMIEASQDWPDDIAVPTLERVIDLEILEDAGTGPGVNALAAAESLLARAPGRFRDRLAAAEDDSPEQEMLLLALLQKPADGFQSTVSSINRIGINASDVLALIVLARDSDRLSAEDVASLELVAASSTAPEAVRTQAAWLAVRHKDAVADAVAALRKPSP